MHKMDYDQMIHNFVHGSALDDCLFSGSNNSKSNSAVVSHVNSSACKSNRFDQKSPMESQAPKVIPSNKIEDKQIPAAKSDFVFNGYVLDANTGIFHSARGRCVKTLGLSGVKPIFETPNIKDAAPCPICMKRKHEKMSLVSYDRLFQRIVQQFCNSHDMYVQFTGNIAYVTTIAGEWYFDYTESDPTLHHRSTEKRFLRSGNVSHYHIQSINLHTCLDVVDYIYKHDMSAIRRMMGGFGSGFFDAETLPDLMDQLLESVDMSKEELFYALSIDEEIWQEWMKSNLQSADLQGVAGIAELLSISVGDLLSFALQFVQEE